MTKPRDTERMEITPEEQGVSSDTQRMKTLDPSSVEPPIIRQFKYDTDHTGPATEDTELIRGINRARDRIDERKADLDAALKTPTPPPSDPGPAPNTDSTPSASRDSRLAPCPAPENEGRLDVLLLRDDRGRDPPRDLRARREGDETRRRSAVGDSGDSYDPHRTYDSLTDEDRRRACGVDHRRRACHNGAAHEADDLDLSCTASAVRDVAFDANGNNDRDGEADAHGDDYRQAAVNRRPPRADRQPVMKRFLSKLMFCALLVASPVIAGEDPRKAKASALHQEAVLALGAKHVDEALAKFREAYDVFPAPNTLFGIARCEQLLGHALPAIRHYREALKNPLLNVNSQAEGKKFILELEQQLGRVQIEAPPGATVSIDGTQIEGFAPFQEPLDLEPGKHSVDMRREQEHAHADVDVPAGHVANVKLESEKTTGGNGNPNPPVVPESNWNGRRTAGVIVGSAGLLAGGFAIGFGVSAAGNASDRDKLTSGMSPSACFGVTSTTCTTINDKAHAAADQSNIAIGLAVGGAALLVTGLVLVALPVSHETHARIWIRPSIGFLEVGAQW